MWLEDLGRDVLYGARTLRRTPAFTSVAVLTLALGIGAVTIIYSVVRNVVLDPFPYSHSERLVNVSLRDPSGRTLGGLFAAEEFLDYEEQTSVFEDVVGTRLEPGVYATSHMGAARLNVAWMTPNGSPSSVFPHCSDAPSEPATRCRARLRWRWYRTGPGFESSGRTRRSSAGPSCSMASRGPSSE